MSPVANASAGAPVCVVVNGPSAVGKSTLVQHLQEVAQQPLLRFGVDELYQMVPPAWAGGVPGARRGEAGFRYVDHGVSPEGQPLRSITNGADALAMLRAMNAAIVAMLDEGMSVVVDGQAFEPSITTDLQVRLDRLVARGRALVVYLQLSARAEVLADRNARHAHPAHIGIHQSELPAQNSAVDMLIDTSDLSTAQIHDQVRSFLARKSPLIFGGS